MISELKNTVRSRISLRSKHLEKLEEQKANLNEIRMKATNHKKLLQHKNSETTLDDFNESYFNPKSIYFGKKIKVTLFKQNF